MKSRLLSSTGLRQFGKRMFPASLLTRVRIPYRAYVFKSTLSRICSLPDGIDPTEKDLKNLIYGWGNLGFGASWEYLAACVKLAREADGPILECGSGLSTLLLGIEASRHGNSVYTLEHIPFWGQKIQAVLNAHRIYSVSLHVAPLRDYGEYHWYDPTTAKMPSSEFSLVICDGPPSKTPGGRYGLLPQMFSRLSPQGVISLDDAHRPPEQAILARWAEEFGLTFEVRGTIRKFALLKRAETQSAGQVGLA